MMALIVTGIVLVVFVFWTIGVYNNLVRLKNMKTEAWSGIDVQLKRRHELVPNLVRTVEGYARHEKDLLERIVRLRAQSVGGGDIAAKVATENQLTQGLKQLFAVAESYPELKANVNFLALQKQLSELEEQLQMARRYYNGAVREYNITIDSFPSSLVASSAGHRPAEFFEAGEEEKTVPTVSFQTPS